MTDIDKLLKFDPLSFAEDVTGQSYKEDEATMAFGFAAHMAHTQRVRDEMSVRDDTHYGTTYVDAVRIVGSLGFTMIHQHAFPGTSYDDTSAPAEDFRMYWREDGVLLNVSSHRGVEGSMDHLKVYYNWVPFDWDTRWDFTSSGSVHTPYDLRDPAGDDRACWTWVGDHDGRTGLRHILARLEANGRFVTPWVERPHLWLVDFSQEKYAPQRYPDSSRYYKEITEAVVVSFPVMVRSATTPA